MDPLDLPTVRSESPTEPDKPDRDQPGYLYARALAETARTAAGERAKSFQRNWDYFMGRNQWPAAASTATSALDAWAFKGVVNWTHTTIKTKAAMITSAALEIYCDPLDEESTYYDRLLAKSAIEDAAKRVRFNQVKYDAYMWGAVSGVGICMITAKPDELTGTMATAMLPVKSSEFFRDPSSDCITSPDCRYVIWEPELDMSTVRQMWPSKAPYVKPEIRQVTGGFTYKADKTDDNLIFGTSGEFVVDQQNVLRSRKARVTFCWVKDESIIEDLQEIILKEPMVGFHCISCDAIHEPDSTPDVSEESPCPMCGGDMETAQIPAKVEQNRIVRRRYPYGRLIAYSGDTLLYDGENPYELEGVYPFAVYHHDRIPGDFYGGNDVSLLQSLQEAENTVLSMGVDGVVLSMFGPFEYPVGCKSYTDMGNGPKERHPVPDHLAGKARFIPSGGADMNLWQGVLNNIEHQFNIVSGLQQMSGQVSSPVISATEAEIANARLSNRMKGEAQAFASFCSDALGILWQMERQFSNEPHTVPVNMPDSEVKSIKIEFQKLPRINVRVEVNTTEAIKDKLKGQNSIPIFTNPAIMASPFLDTILSGIGYTPSEIKEVMNRRGLQGELGQPPTPQGMPTEGAPIG